MDKQMLEILSKPFDPQYIGHLPRVTCRDCKDASRGSRQSSCGRHKMINCKVCKNFLSEAHQHDSYVSHADVENRLNNADPNWTYEPLAFDENGFPLAVLDVDGNWIMWIRMTVGGVTRLGVGSLHEVPNKDAKAANVPQDDLRKKLISDALKNAAMRFGVGLELWSIADRLEVCGSGDDDMRSASMDDAQLVAAPTQQDATVDGSLDLLEDGVELLDTTASVNATAGDVGFADDDYKEPAAPKEALIAEAMVNRIRKMFTDFHKTLPEQREYTSSVVGREVAKLTELTRKEGAMVVKALQADLESLVSE